MSVALRLAQLSEKMQPCGQFRLATLIRKNYFLFLYPKIICLKICDYDRIEGHCIKQNERQCI